MGVDRRNMWRYVNIVTISAFLVVSGSVICVCTGRVCAKGWDVYGDLSFFILDVTHDDWGRVSLYKGVCSL